MTTNHKTTDLKSSCSPVSATRAVVPAGTVAEVLRLQTEIVRAQNAQVQKLVDACTDVSHAAAELLRSRASTPAPSRPRKPPPPVTTHLRQFADLLANKIDATIALLTQEQRTRLGALVPAFVRASLANEPDVVATVVRWFDIAPEDIARDLATNLDTFEHRFAL